MSDHHKIKDTKIKYFRVHWLSQPFLKHLHSNLTNGQSMIVNKNPEINPKIIEKLSTIGKSPIISSPIKIASIFIRGQKVLMYMLFFIKVLNKSKYIHL